MEHITESDLVVQPPEGDLSELRSLQARLATSEAMDLKFADGTTVELTMPARQALRLAVDYLARNLAVAIEPYSEVLTTQRAADLLKVSRPSLVELLRRRVMPYRETEGGHRRILLADVLDYQQRSLGISDESDLTAPSRDAAEQPVDDARAAARSNRLAVR
ncbi:MAG: helix-turn-helix domain-containing protein [Candidatus Dormibacteraeota bacterium]|uniref:Helix-turn-helix domain-containing protein n=1 Tax=Candidatus Amunia macphersoniae TaxID=3127014 RepID=A0A934KQG2_9BACT|nr:helix-turn-helix domain-containing protein [Candidatus Dormibacteraeota bacterium]